MRFLMEMLFWPKGEGASDLAGAQESVAKEGRNYETCKNDVSPAQ